MMTKAEKNLLIEAGVIGTGLLAWLFYTTTKAPSLPPSSQSTSDVETDAGEVWDFVAGQFNLVLHPGETTSVFLPQARGRTYAATSRQQGIASVRIIGDRAIISGIRKGRAQIDIVARDPVWVVMTLAVDVVS